MRALAQAIELRIATHTHTMGSLRSCSNNKGVRGRWEPRRPMTKCRNVSCNMGAPESHSPATPTRDAPENVALHVQVAQVLALDYCTKLRPLHQLDEGVQQYLQVRERGEPPGGRRQRRRIRLHGLHLAHRWEVDAIRLWDETKDNRCVVCCRGHPIPNQTWPKPHQIQPDPAQTSSKSTNSAELNSKLFETKPNLAETARQSPTQT